MRLLALLTACAFCLPGGAALALAPEAPLSLAPALGPAPLPESATAAAPLEHLLPPDQPRITPQIKPIDLATPHEQVWGRIRGGFGMPDLGGDLVEDRMAWYLARPHMLQALFERGRKYLFHIVAELEKRGMPTELALLPMVESAFNPQAFSSARAAGLWQFIPSTGKDFNLTQNWWVDERRDIVASTNAALQYLQAVYELHGDWQLALASYNWGENAVARAVAANKAAGKPTDYSSLRMPQETRYYVPKLQALKNIVANPEKYGIHLPEVPNEPYFVTVERVQRMDIAVAAQLAELPLKEFLSLNPGYNRPVMPGSDNAQLVLPVENARKFKDNLSRHDAPLSTWRTYSISKSERIEQVAKRLNIGAELLRLANGLPSGARLAAGYTLLIPNGSGTQHEALKEVLPRSPAGARPVVKSSYKPTAKSKPVARSYRPAPRR